MNEIHEEQLETLCIDDCDHKTYDECKASGNDQMSTDYCKVCGLLYFVPEAIRLHNMASQDMHTMPLPDELPFRPWWYAPHKGKRWPDGDGRHRGEYKYWPPIGVDEQGRIRHLNTKTGTAIALPHGDIRGVKLTPYVDFYQGPISTGPPFTLPDSVTMSFSESEEFPEIKGDDVLIATSSGPRTVSWEMEPADINLEVWKMLTGGQVQLSSKTLTRYQRVKAWLKRCVTRQTNSTKNG